MSWRTCLLHACATYQTLAIGVRSHPFANNGDSRNCMVFGLNPCRQLKPYQRCRNRRICCSFKVNGPTTHSICVVSRTAAIHVRAHDDSRSRYHCSRIFVSCDIDIVAISDRLHDDNRGRVDLRQKSCQQLKPYQAYFGLTFTSAFRPVPVLCSLSDRRARSVFLLRPAIGDIYIRFSAVSMYKRPRSVCARRISRCLGRHSRQQHYHLLSLGHVLYERASQSAGYSMSLMYVCDIRLIDAWTFVRALRTQMRMNK